MNRNNQHMSIVKINVPTRVSKKWMNSAQKLGISRSEYLLAILEEKGHYSDVTTKKFQEDSFEIFWKDYPNKKSKQQSKKAFLRLTKKDINDILIVYKDHLEFWDGKEKQFIPHASTWLNQRRWEDEIESAEEKFAFNKSRKPQKKRTKPKQLNFLGKVMSKLKC